MTHPDHSPARLAQGYRAAGYDPQTADQIAAMDLALTALTSAGWTIDSGSGDPNEGCWAISPETAVVFEIRAIAE